MAEAVLARCDRPAIVDAGAGAMLALRSAVADSSVAFEVFAANTVKSRKPAHSGDPVTNARAPLWINGGTNVVNP